ncbi:MAG: response regulator transcription factor [Bacteroidota bacterium]
MQPISVVLADSQFLIRLGLKHLLSGQENINIVGEVVKEQQLVGLLEETEVGVVILDYNQPGSFSLQTIEKVKSTAPTANILIVSADDEKESIYQVLESGVNSYLTKSCDDKEILDAIHATAKGEKFFCTRVLDYLLEKSFARPDETCRPTPLTPREIEIVRLVAQGLIAKEIADVLSLSTHTVYTHRKNIMKKLKLSTSSELVLYAINNGIVEQV